MIKYILPYENKQAHRGYNLGNITLAELDAITARSVARAKAGYDSNLTPNERRDRIQELLASGQLTDYELSLLGTDIKNIAPNYAALKAAVEEKKAAIKTEVQIGGEIDITASGRKVREKEIYSTGREVERRYTYRRTSPIPVDPRTQSLAQRPTNIATGTSVTSIPSRNQTYDIASKIPRTGETDVSKLPPLYPFGMKSEVRATSIDRRSTEFKLGTIEIKKARREISPASANIGVFALGAYDAGKGAITNPGETIATVGAFAVNPLLGAAFVAATSGKEIVIGLRDQPTYTLGGIAGSVGLFEGGRFAIKAPKRFKTAANERAFKQQFTTNTEPLQMGQRTIAIEPDMFSQTLGRTVYEKPTFYDTKAGQLKLKPGGTVSNNLVEITKVAFKEQAKPLSPINPTQRVLGTQIYDYAPKSKFKTVDVKGSGIRRVSGQEAILPDMSKQTKIRSFKDTLNVRATEFKDYPNYKFTSAGEFTTFSPTESGAFVKTGSVKLSATEARTPASKKIDFGFNKMFVVEPLSASIYGVGKLIEVGKTTIQRGGLFERGNRFQFEKFDSAIKIGESSLPRVTPRVGIFPVQRENALPKSLPFTGIKSSIDLGLDTGIRSDTRYRQDFKTSTDIKVDTKIGQKQRQRQSTIGINIFKIPTPGKPSDPGFPRDSFYTPPTKTPPTKIPIIDLDFPDDRRKSKRKKKRKESLKLLDVGFKYSPSIEAALFNVRGTKAPKIPSLQIRPILK